MLRIAADLRTCQKAASIGIEAAKSRVSTYFINCNNLVLQLKRAHLENRLDQRIKWFNHYRLLIIDEVGFLPLEQESSKLLFQLLSKRYEKSSTIITTNKNLSQWGEVFCDNVLANAILDSLELKTKLKVLKRKENLLKPNW